MVLCTGLRTALAAALAGVVMLAGACGSGSGTTEVVEDPTSTTTATADPGDVELCAAAAEVATTGAELDRDPAAALAAVDDLAAAVPDEVADDVAVLRDAVASVAAVDTDGPGGVAEVMDVLLDPEVTTAVAVVNELTLERCGVDLNDVGVSEDASGG